MLPESMNVQGIPLAMEFVCHICGEKFPKRAQADFEAHVAKCAHQNLHDLQKMSPRVIAPGIYGDAGVDTDYRDWLRKKHHGDGPRTL